MSDVTVVIPAKNESKHIVDVIRRIRNVSKNYEILVIDDGSTDNTAEIAESMGCKCIKLDRNYGKGYACRIGAVNAKGEFVVFIDSDSQLNPEEIPNFVEELKNCDMVIGYRNMSMIPWQRRLANNFSRKLISFITGKRFNDVLCGFRAVRKPCFLKLGLRENRYEFESESLIKAVKKGLRVKEIPVSVSYEKGSRMGIKESFKVLKYLAKQSIENLFA